MFYIKKMDDIKQEICKAAETYEKLSELYTPEISVELFGQGHGNCLYQHFTKIHKTICEPFFNYMSLDQKKKLIEWGNKVMDKDIGRSLCIMDNIFLNIKYADQLDKFGFDTTNVFKYGNSISRIFSEGNEIAQQRFLENAINFVDLPRIDRSFAEGQIPISIKIRPIIKNHLLPPKPPLPNPMHEQVLRQLRLNRRAERQQTSHSHISSETVSGGGLRISNTREKSNSTDINNTKIRSMAELCGLFQQK